MKQATAFLLGALVMGALSSSAPPRVGAHEVMFAHPGDTIQPFYSFLTADSSITRTADAKAMIATSKCGAGHFFLRSKRGGSFRTADSITVIVYGCPGSPDSSQMQLGLPAMASACDSALVKAGVRGDTGSVVLSLFPACAKKDTTIAPVTISPQ